MNTHRTGVAAEVRAAISRAGVSRRDLAERVGMVPDTLYRKLRAERPFTVEELLSIAQALDIRASGLLPQGDAGQAARQQVTR